VFSAEHALAARISPVSAAGSALQGVCGSLVARADQAKRSLRGHVWRTAHPTAPGQRALATEAERVLRGRV
jgi:hypothetical protein